MDTISTSAGKLIVVGDFNIHVDNQSDVNANRLKSIIDAAGLHQHVNVPTHSSPHIGLNYDQVCPTVLCKTLMCLYSLTIWP